jgi:hypothetical protein
MMMIQAPMTMMPQRSERESESFLRWYSFLPRLLALPFAEREQHRNERKKFSLSSDGAKVSFGLISQSRFARQLSLQILRLAFLAFLFCSLAHRRRRPGGTEERDSYLTFLVWMAFRLLLHRVAQTPWQEAAAAAENTWTREKIFFPISPIVMRRSASGLYEHEIHHICSVQINAVTGPMLLSSRRIPRRGMKTFNDGNCCMLNAKPSSLTLFPNTNVSESQCCKLSCSNTFGGLCF